MLKAIETKYLDPSGLSDEEKEEAKRTIVRVVRGAIEEKLDEDDIEQITKHFLVDSNSDSTNRRRQELKSTLTDDELRTLLTEAKDIVDSREVADEEDYDVKLSEVIREIVDESLAE